MPDDRSVYEGLTPGTRLEVEVVSGNGIYFEEHGMVGRFAAVRLSYDQVERLISDLVRRTPGQAKEIKPQELA